MTKCNRCGANIEFGDQDTVQCIYCHADNPRPRGDAPVHDTAPVAANPYCPHCNVRLTLTRTEHAALAGCPQCAGFWIDSQSATALMQSPQRVFIKLADQMSRKAKGKVDKREDPKCPTCEGSMKQVESHGITIDVCAAHGTWFDAHELQDMLKARLADASNAGAPGDKVLCVGCKAVITREHANKRARGLLCDKCYREDRAKAVKNNSTDTSMAVVGGAFEVVGGVLQVLVEILAGFA
jgi:Zn-finger nucleic acid-binding protein